MCCNHSIAENSTFIAHVRIIFCKLLLYLPCVFILSKDNFLFLQVIKDCKLIERVLDNEKWYDKFILFNIKLPE